MANISVKANKRSYVIVAPKRLPRGDTQVTVENGKWQARDGGLMIARDGGEMLFRTSSGFPYLLQAPKRSFVIVAPKVETE